MAKRSVSFDFLMGRNTVSAGTKKVARDLDDLEDHAGKAGRGAGKRFRDGFGDGVDEKGSLFKKLVTPNPQLFEGLKHTLAYTLSTPLGLGIAAALTTALAAAIPSAITAALGGGLIALGAFALKGSTVLKRHFKSAGNVISESLRQAAQPLKGPFLQAIETVTGAMLQLQPIFRGLFKGLKPAIRPLVDGFVGLARNALPGLQAALPGINAAFQQMGARMPGLGRTVGNFFAAISENLPAIQRGIDLMFTLTEVLINVGGAFLTLAQKASNGLSTVTSWWSKLEDLLPGVHKGQKDAASSAETLANNQGHLAIAAQKAGAANQLLMEKAKKTREAFYQQRAAIAGVIPIFEGYSSKSTITKNKILSNLRQEVDAYRNWASNAQTLLRKGADPSVVKALSDKGPQYVAAFVHASGRELQQLNGLFKSRTQAAGSVAVATAGAAGAAMGRAAASGFAANFHPNLRVGAINPGGGGKGGRGAGGKRTGRALAGGGILREPVAGIGLRSGTSYLMGERGPEAVVPLGRGGGGNSYHISVTVSPGGNPAETGGQIVKLIREHERRSGTSWRAS